MKENKSLFTGLIVGAIITGALMYFFMQKKADQAKANLDILHQAQYAMLIDSVRQNGLANLMASLLDKVEKELTQTPDHTLSEATIKQISALSDGFKPYAILKGDQLSSNKFSPERGHLLLMLLGMEMDSLTWQEILSSVTFANADLKDADLHEANLSGANLSAANFKDAKLRGIRLDDANLRFATLWGADLQESVLTGVDATRANFSWADLTQAKVDSAILNGADLSSADFSSAYLINSTFHWSNLSGTYFNRADLSDADLLGSLIEKTQFVETNLTGTNFVKTVIHEMDMTGALMQGVTVQDECWLSRLSDISVKGASAIQDKYTIKTDTTNQVITFYLDTL